MLQQDQTCEPRPEFLFGQAALLNKEDCLAWQIFLKMDAKFYFEAEINQSHVL
jgi:hypothetical protein